MFRSFRAIAVRSQSGWKYTSSSSYKLQRFHRQCHAISSIADGDAPQPSHRLAGVNQHPMVNMHQHHHQQQQQRQMQMLRREQSRGRAQTADGLTDTKKRKVVLIVGYCGTGYRGLQMDPNETEVAIETVLFDALYRSGFILESNYVDRSLRKIGWDRGSRTDKGVHSLCTVISVKLEFSQEQLQSLESDPLGMDIADKVNQELPSEIRIFSVQRPHNSFGARNDLLWRKYHYVIPMDALKDGEASIPVLNQQLQYYRGNKMFHNFTVSSRQLLTSGAGNQSKHDNAAQTPHQPDSYLDEESSLRKVVRKEENILFMRNVYHADCDTVITDPSTGKKFGIITILGMSFMRHQIRKMIGTAVCVVNGILPDDYIHLAIESDIKMPTPLAPSEGLYLFSAQPRARAQGDTIDLKEDMLLTRVYDFQHNMLLPHVQEILADGTVFDSFFETVKSNQSISEEKYEAIRNEAVKFVEWRKEKRREKFEVWKEVTSRKISDTPLYRLDIQSLLPPGFSTELCLRHNITPGPDLSNVFVELHAMMIRGKALLCQPDQYYLDIIDHIGFDEMSTRGEAIRSRGHSVQKELSNMEFHFHNRRREGDRNRSENRDWDRNRNRDRDRNDWRRPNHRGSR